MGRELRRVPIDFDWPLNKVWRGFINPHYKPCPEQAHGRCHAGYSPAGQWLDAVVRLIALIGEEAASNTPERREHMRRTGRTYPHPYLEEWGQAPRTEIPHAVHSALAMVDDRHERFRRLESYLRKHPPRLLELDAEIAELVQGLAKGEPFTMFGSSSVAYAIGQTLKEVAGVDGDRWGVCKVCDGHGMDPAATEAYDAWEAEDPPTGEGWQLWETVSEGSPVSPVFPTESAFIDYLVSEGYSRAAAEAFAERGWAPSGMARVGPDGDAELFADIEALGGKAEADPCP